MVAVVLLGWLPRGIVSTQARTDDMLARLATPSPGAGRIEHYRLVAGTTTLVATALLRGRDFRIDTTIDGYDYALGRVDGKSWRRTPSGVVRVIRSDVQGDDLDRWPRSVFGFSFDGCHAAGATSAPSAEWVLACREPGDIVHVYDVDPQSGRIDAETTREGSRVVQYTFGPGAPGDGRQRPAHWRIAGAGGDAEVTRLDSQPRDVAPDDVAIPATVSAQFAFPPNGHVEIPARFPDGNSKWLRVPVSIGGRTLSFIVDTGTSQILMDAGAAAQLGLHTTLGHAVARDVRVGDAVATDLPIETVDLFGGRITGLLGNEFFTGHVVHVDYANGRLEWLARDGFVPPRDADEIALDASEGLPLVDVTVDGHKSSRFTLDSAGTPTILSAAFAGAHAIHDGDRGPRTHTINYLEGMLEVSPAAIGELVLGRYTLTNPTVSIEVPNDENIDLTLDGIVGSTAMATFEWWLDYDGKRAWIRR